MRKPALPLAILALSLSSAPAVRAQTAAAASLPSSAVTPSLETRTAASPDLIQRVVDRVRPSLVRIHVVEGVPENGADSKQEVFGSGIIISPDGYVVTNHHVAGNARWLSVTLSSKEVVSARLVGSDPLSDIAVLKLAPSPTGPYPAIAWGDSLALKVGDPVLAMGSPLAFSQSVTSGIVSNTELILPDQFESMTLEGEDVGSIVRWIGHDATIFPGNSGGPLISLAGEIVGINEIGVGLSGAIPANIARRSAEQIIAQGHVTRAYTGLDLQPRFTGAASDPGVLIGGVLPGSPAAKAGLRHGDLLMRAAGTTMSARFPEQLPLLNWQLSLLTVGQPVEFDVERDGKPLTLMMTPSRREPAEAHAFEIKGWGLTCSDLTRPAAQERREDSTEGALVTTLATGGPSAEAQPPLKEDDIIVAVAGKKIANIAALRAATAALPQSEEGTPALVEFKRDGQHLVTVIEVGKKSAEDTSVEVAKAWLPIDVQVVTAPIARALALPDGVTGVRVIQLYGEAAPAAVVKAFHIGDVIVKLDDAPVAAEQPEQTDVLFAMIRQYRIGTPIKVTLYRAGKRQVITVPTVRSPRQERELARYVDDTFGLTVRSVSYKDRADGDAGPSEQGALVVDVAKGGWAALAELQPHDIIHAIDGKPVGDADAVAATLKALDKTHPPAVVFFVSRGIHTLYVRLQTDYSLTSPPASAARAVKP